MYRKNWFYVFLIIQIFFSVQKSFGQKMPETIELELNKSIERTIGGETETHVYKISLKANQYAKIKIVQQTVSANVKLSAPDGNSIIEKNGEAAADENKIKTLEFVSQTSGDYQIQIRNALPNAPAGKYSIVLAEIREATANDKTLDEARRGWVESVRLRTAGNFDQAIESSARALEIYEKNPEADKSETVQILLNLSNLYFIKNNAAQAEAFQKRAAEFSAKNFGEESLPFADATNVLAFVRQGQRNYAEAEPIFLKVLAIREKTAGETSLAAALSHSNLGVLYRAMGDYPKAEAHFSRSLAIYEKLLGDNRFETANLLNHFGMFYYGAGDYPGAEKLLLRSLKIKEKVFPAQHREIGIAFNNLGLIAWKSGDYEKAKEYYLRALKIFEIVNGTESDGVANILANLAIIYKESDANLTKAEEFYKRALAITIKIRGENNQAVADFLSSLSILYRSMKDFGQAEEFGLRAQRTYESILGEYNHYSLLSLGNLVKLYGAKGDFEKSFEYAEKLAAIHEKVIPLNLLSGSERQKFAYYDLTNRFDQTLTLHIDNAPENEQIRDLAATALLRHKGRVLDAVSESLESLQTRLAPEDKKLLDDLADVNARLSKTLLSKPQNLSPDERERQVKNLEDEREKIEKEISRRSAGFYQPTAPVTLEQIKSLIPDDVALVEFAVYRPQRWTQSADRQEFAAPRYAVYVIRPNGEVKWKLLGETKDFDKLIEDFRRDLENSSSKNLEKSARALEEKLMKPLRALTIDAKRLLISPDGALNLIPFEALRDENGKYLIENYEISYLTSGRDLLRMQTQRESKNKSLIIANPLFGKASVENADEKNPRQSVTATRDITETYFAPLAGTINEANSIKKEFPAATVLTGADANENALKKTPAPRILHIASHGFFLENTDELESDSKKRGSAGGKEETKNPLLRSGIALAGANERKGGDAKDDGILTALEASGLNLWGTKLVVLSACDTGIGDVKNGEGVYGLRRAFTLAGTETLVMSLWAVSDLATRELMTDFYKNLKNGEGRGESLRKAKLEMLRKKGRTHPFYWAAFIQTGEWANLDGNR